jgi:hypothetical protein
MSGRSITVAVIAVFALALATAAMAADDPFVGTWKMNMDKSTRRSAIPVKSITNRFDLQGNVLKRVEDIVRVDGTVRQIELAAVLDGKDHPITDNPNQDAYQANRVDSNTVVIVFKKGGKEVRTQRLVVSKDRKTLTITDNGKNDQGQEISYMSINDRQ